MRFASKDTDYPDTIPHDGADGCRAGQISFGQRTADKFSGVHGSVSRPGRSMQIIYVGLDDMDYRLASWMER